MAELRILRVQAEGLKDSLIRSRQSLSFLREATTPGLGICAFVGLTVAHATR
jgi:hypothetical protein